MKCPWVGTRAVGWIDRWLGVRVGGEGRWRAVCGDDGRVAMIDTCKGASPKDANCG